MNLDLLAPNPLPSSAQLQLCRGLRGPCVSSRVTPPQCLFPSPSPQNQHSCPAGWGRSAVTAHFSPLTSASLVTSVSPSCAFKLDPRRNFKANSSTCDGYESCHCLRCYRAVRCQRALLPATLPLFFPAAGHQLSTKGLSDTGATASPHLCAFFSMKH